MYQVSKYLKRPLYIICNWHNQSHTDTIMTQCCTRSVSVGVVLFFISENKQQINIIYIYRESKFIKQQTLESETSNLWSAVQPALLYQQSTLPSFSMKHCEHLQLNLPEAPKGAESKSKAEKVGWLIESTGTIYFQVLCPVPSQTDQLCLRPWIIMYHT